ncbi:MAG: hypothetical protein O9972_25785 [Burkholderiales bacterium]|nr:hypothetical protein [Burkholderiales bacterium]
MRPRLDASGRRAASRGRSTVDARRSTLDMGLRAWAPERRRAVGGDGTGTGTGQDRMGAMVPARGGTACKRP